MEEGRQSVMEISSDGDKQKTSTPGEHDGKEPDKPEHHLPQTPDKDDSAILVIDEDSPELSTKLEERLNTKSTINSASATPAELPGIGKQSLESDSKEKNVTVLRKSASDPKLSDIQKHSASASGQTHTHSQEIVNKNSVSESGNHNATAQITGDVLNTDQGGVGMQQATEGQPTFLRSTSAPADDSNLNQAALTLLKRLEFKNPGRKQMDYGNFNPEESEREKKKLRRFQASKPRPGVCYKEDGTLFDGRNICDCLTEECPGCFYPCPQCSSQKCGPTCRTNRKWVYDYIEDEGRNYRVEFPESAMNLGL